MTTQNEVDLTLAIANMGVGSRFEAEEAHVTRDPRTGRIIKSRDYGADDALVVTFTTEQVLSKLETYKAGGIPTYIDMDFITIVVPGNRDLTIHTQVTDFYQWRFPKEYDAFKNGKDLAASGTPLAKWDQLTKGQIKELEHHGIHTVEQIASLSDSVSGVLRGFYVMKERARAFLEGTAGTAQQEAMNAELAKRDAELEAMKAQLASLMKLVEDKGTAARSTKGRDQ